jgi:hypothetical protein
MEATYASTVASGTSSTLGLSALGGVRETSSA